MRMTHRITMLMFGMGLWVNDYTDNLVRRMRRDERGDVPGWVMITFVTSV